jgi:hypothetical protein
MTDIIAIGERLHRNEEARIRRRLAVDGLALRKSRTRNPSAADYSTYMVVDTFSNAVVAGPGLIIDDIAMDLESRSR